MNMHCQTRVVGKKKQEKKKRKTKSNANHILEVVMISSYEHKPSYCNLDLECMNQFFLHMTLCLIMMYILGLVTKLKSKSKVFKYAK